MALVVPTRLLLSACTRGPPLAGIPFCALQRNKLSRRKDAALRMDDEIFMLMFWLMKVLAVPQGSSSSSDESGTQGLWTAKTLQATDALRSSVQHAKQGGTGRIDYMQLAERWLQDLLSAYAPLIS